MTKHQKIALISIVVSLQAQVWALYYLLGKNDEYVKQHHRILRILSKVELQRHDDAVFRDLVRRFFEDEE